MGWVSGEPRPSRRSHHPQPGVLPGLLSRAGRARLPRAAQQCSPPRGSRVECARGQEWHRRRATAAGLRGSVRIPAAAPVGPFRTILGNGDQRRKAQCWLQFAPGTWTSGTGSGPVLSLERPLVSEARDLAPFSAQGRTRGKRPSSGGVGGPGLGFPAPPYQSRPGVNARPRRWARSEMRQSRPEEPTADGRARVSPG